MLSSVAVIVGDGVSPFELGLLCEAWGIDRRDDGVPMPTSPCAPVPGRIAGAVGFDLFVEHDLSRAADVDLVCVAPIKGDRPVPAEVLVLLRSTVDRAVPACSRLLRGVHPRRGRSARRCRSRTTHWMGAADRLACRFPAARRAGGAVRRRGPGDHVGGHGCGDDAAPHLWRKGVRRLDHATVARRMVLPRSADGG
ncbi:MAG: hypothetical protein U0R65_07865 [Candidatus Nanopelagicales bacterium]